MCPCHVVHRLEGLPLLAEQRHPTPSGSTSLGRRHEPTSSIGDAEAHDGADVRAQGPCQFMIHNRVRMFCHSRAEFSAIDSSNDDCLAEERAAADADNISVLDTRRSGFGPALA